MSKKKIKEKLGIKKASEIAPTKYSSTGFIRIDDARSERGRLGLKHGAITVIYGQTGAGKSTLTYQIVGNIQKNDPEGKPWLVVDIESSFDAQYAEARGMDLDRVDVMPVQEWIDEALEGVRQLIMTEEYAGVIVDSIHGQAAKRDDKSIEDERSVGALPMKITQFIQTTKAAVAKSGVMMILIGQARDNMDKYGDAIHLTGGNQLKHDADLTLQMTRSDATSRCDGIIPKSKTEGQRYDGHMALIKVEKARGRGMGKRFTMPFLNSEGFSEHRCLIEEAAIADWGKEIFNTTSHHYRWTDVNGEEIKLNGKAKLLEYFSGNEVELDRLQNEVLGYISEEKVEVDEEQEEVTA